MIAPDIGRPLFRLALRQAAFRWLIGLWRWLALMAALWGVLSLAAVLSELPRLAYYGMLLAALGALPAFLAYPPDGEPLIELVRRIDGQAALESYLCQKEGAARELLEPRAKLALRLALLDPPPRPRLPARYFAALAVGIALFVLAQAMSIRAGYGISLGYPEKGLLKAPERIEDAEPASDYRPEYSILSPEDVPGEASGTNARPAGASVDSGDVSVARGAVRRPGNEPLEPEVPRGQDDAQAEGRSEDQRAEAGGGGTEAGAQGEREEDTEEEAPKGSARQFGYEGSGRALEPSPLLDYRAVFEREYVARTGEESALGPNTTPARAQESIAAYYLSFSRDLILSARAESRVEELKSAWLRLGREGGAESEAP